MLISKKNIFVALGFAVASVILIFLCNNPFELIDKTIFYIFQERDIGRAQKIMEGKAIFFGPEMTGGGYLPGPLYYIFLSIALFFKNNWVGAWIMQYALVVIATLAGAFYLRKTHSYLMAFLWILFFISSRFTTFYINLFLNVSSMFPFLIIAMIFIDKTFSSSPERERRNSFFISCLMIGLGIQFHFSLIVLFLATLFMFVFHKKLKLETLSFKTILSGSLILILPSIPYIVWLNATRLGHPFGEQGFYNGKTDEAVSSIVHLIELGLAEPIGKILLSWLNKFIFTTPFALLIILFSNLIFKITNSHKEASRSIHNLKPLIICLIFSFIPHFNWYFSTQGMRYSMPFYISLIFLTIMMYHSISLSAPRLKVFNITAGISQLVLLGFLIYLLPSDKFKEYFLAVILISTFLLSIYFLFKLIQTKFEKGFLVSFLLMSTLALTQKHLVYNTIGTDGYMPSSEDWTQTWEAIFSKTGWDYNKAKGKIYYIGHHVNQAPGLFLKGTDLEKRKGQITPDEEGPPDGFFVSNRYKRYVSIKGNKADPMRWFYKLNLQPSIMQGLKNGDIKVGHNLSAVNLITPYWIKNKNKLPSQLHNTGEGYSLSSEDLQLEQINSDEGVKLVGPNQLLFKWNESPDQDPFCSTGAVVNLEKSSRDEYKLKIRVIGGAISQISPWVSPNWTQSWISPFVEIACGKSKMNFLISDSIGFRRVYSHLKWTPFFSGNNSLVAPLEKEITFSCTNEIKSIRLGRTGSEVEKITKVSNLEEKSIEYIF